MNPGVLKQFLEIECDDSVRRLLISTIAAARSGRGPARRRLEFNVFEVTIDAEHGTATLEDVLDPSAEGQYSVPISQLEEALGSA